MQYTFIPLFLGNLRGSEFIILAIAALLLFGAKKIPSMMRNLGKGVHAFKQGIADAKEEIVKPIEKSVEEPAQTDKPVEPTAKAKDVD